MCFFRMEMLSIKLQDGNQEVISKHSTGDQITLISFNVGVLE